MKKIDLINSIDAKSSKKEEEVSEWLKSSPENRRYFDYLKTLWVLSALPQERADELEYVKFKNRFYTVKKNSSQRLLYYSFAAVAASVLIFFAIKLYINVDDKDLVLISNNEPETQYYHLPDNTRITLLPGSEVTYNNDSFMSNRLLSVKGKAFFEVTSNKDYPFRVNTNNNIEITVTGTKFFVNTQGCSNNEENRFETFLKEGRVSVKSQKGDTIIYMLPGDIVIADASLKLTKLSGAQDPQDLKKIFSYLCFKNEKMGNVLSKLEHYYNVTFKYDSNIDTLLFTGDLNEENLKTTLNLFKYSMDMQYTVKDGVISFF